LPDHSRAARSLGDLAGEQGLILGFTGDIWRPASVRRILWLQRHAHLIQRTGFNLALLIRDEPHMVYGFYASSPTPPGFPMLADVDGAVHQRFGLEGAAGMVVLDRALTVQESWLVTADRVWPRLQEILDVLETIH
jgi:peroxiredoxin